MLLVGVALLLVVHDAAVAAAQRAAQGEVVAAEPGKEAGTRRYQALFVDVCWVVVGWEQEDWGQAARVVVEAPAVAAIASDQGLADFATVGQHAGVVA